MATKKTLEKYTFILQFCHMIFYIIHKPLEKTDLEMIIEYKVEYAMLARLKNWAFRTRCIMWRGTIQHLAGDSLLLICISVLAHISNAPNGYAHKGSQGNVFSLKRGLYVLTQSTELITNKVFVQATSKLTGAIYFTFQFYFLELYLINKRWLTRTDYVWRWEGLYMLLIIFICNIYLLICMLLGT